MLGMGALYCISRHIYEKWAELSPRAESLFRNIRIETLNCVILSLW